jgi:hypothetical protein
MVLLAVMILVACGDDDPGSVPTADEDDLRRSVVFRTPPFDEAEPTRALDPTFGLGVGVPVSRRTAPGRLVDASLDLLAVGVVWTTVSCSSFTDHGVHMRGWLEMPQGYAPVRLDHDPHRGLLSLAVLTPTVDTEGSPLPTYHVELVGCSDEDAATFRPLLEATIDPMIGCTHAEPIDPEPDVEPLVHAAYTCRTNEGSGVVLLAERAADVEALVDRLGRAVGPEPPTPCPGETPSAAARRSQLWVVSGASWVLMTQDVDLSNTIQQRLAPFGVVDHLAAPPAGYPTDPNAECE